jgi:hypothetical protein
MLLGFGQGHADECIAGRRPWLPPVTPQRIRDPRRR